MRKKRVTLETTGSQCSPLLTTTSTVPPSDNCAVLGVVMGACVLSRSIIKDLGATLKNTTGGELTTYTSLLESAFELSFQRLQAKAHALGADGIFGVQAVCPEVAGGAAEVLLIGTAYRLENRREEPPA